MLTLGKGRESRSWDQLKIAEKTKKVGTLSGTVLQQQQQLVKIYHSSIS
jgi:hypothetical protein